MFLDRVNRKAILNILVFVLLWVASHINNNNNKDIIKKISSVFTAIWRNGLCVRERARARVTVIVSMSQSCRLESDLLFKNTAVFFCWLLLLVIILYPSDCLMQFLHYTIISVSVQSVCARSVTWSIRCADAELESLESICSFFSDYVFLSHRGPRVWVAGTGVTFPCMTYSGMEQVAIVTE